MRNTTARGCVVVVAGLTAAAIADDRDVKITSVNFETGVFELHNFGEADVDLSAWRWCSADENEVQKYSGANGLNDVTIEAGTSILFYFNNDAPGGGDEDNINRSSMLGTWAEPFDAGPYGLGIYFDDPGFPPINFGNGDSMADYLQWDIDGAGDVTADFRADEAVEGGLWTGVDDWIATAEDTVEILLKDDASGKTLHGPDDYEVVGPDEGCFADCNDDGMLNVLDFVCYQQLFSSGDDAADCNDDATLNILDFTCFQSAFAEGCP